MLEIFLDKERYDEFIKLLLIRNGSVEPFSGYDVILGETKALGAEEFLDLYVDIRTIVQKYKWSLEHLLLSMENAASEIEQVEKDIAGYIGQAGAINGI